MLATVLPVAVFMLILYRLWSVYFSSVNLTNIAGIVHCCGKIPADRKSFEIIKTLAIRRLHLTLTLKIRQTVLTYRLPLSKMLPNRLFKYAFWQSFSQKYFAPGLMIQAATPVCVNAAAVDTRIFPSPSVMLHRNLVPSFLVFAVITREGML